MNYKVIGLKLNKRYFKDVFEWRKKFEVRFNDRDFRVGDVLVLKEWDEVVGVFTGRECFRKVIYMCDLSEIGLKGYVGLGLGLSYRLP